MKALLVLHPILQLKYYIWTTDALSGSNGKLFASSDMEYSFNTDYWNYRSDGKTVTLGTISLDKSYSYIKILHESTIFYINSYYSSNYEQLDFPDKDIIINNNDLYKITDDIYRVYDAFLSVSFSGKTVTIQSGFGSADQASINGKAYCRIALECYI